MVALLRFEARPNPADHTHHAFEQNDGATPRRLGVLRSDRRQERFLETTEPAEDAKAASEKRASESTRNRLAADHDGNKTQPPAHDQKETLDQRTSKVEAARPREKGRADDQPELARGGLTISQSLRGAD